MYKVLKNHVNSDKNIVYIVCDSATEIPTIPLDGLPMGSELFVIATSETYILNGNSQWVLKGV